MIPPGAIPFYTHGFPLAPMAGYSDPAFRMTCRSFGATCTVTEMVSVQGLTRSNAGTCRLLHLLPGEAPVGVQLYGSNPADFERTAATVAGMGFAFIDINAGCPVRKVLAGNCGAALLRDVPRLLDIVSACAAGAGGLPVTLKIRLGWDPGSPVPEDIGELARGRGASAMTVHARYRTDMFEGPARVEDLRRLVSASPIPVVANGDSTSPSAALRLRDESGATGVLVGRGAIGRPWFFRELSGRGPGHPLPGELRETIIRHLELSRLYVPEPFAYHFFRGHLVRYLRGFRGASALRAEAVSIECMEDVVAVLDRAEPRS